MSNLQNFVNNFSQPQNSSKVQYVFEMNNSVLGATLDLIGGSVD
jgi:hypothetical protein